MSLQDGSPSFRLGVSLHEKYKAKEAGKRDIIFTCKTEYDRDRWAAAIEYLKTRAIYEAYAKNNKLVSFIRQENDIDKMKDHDNDEMDKTDLLYDFGDNLKATTNSNFGQTIGSPPRSSFQKQNHSFMRAPSFIRRQSNAQS